MPWRTSDVNVELLVTSPSVQHVSPLCVGIYQDVVQEDEDEVIKVIGEDIVHHIHELYKGALVTPKGITKNSHNPQ